MWEREHFFFLGGVTAIICSIYVDARYIEQTMAVTLVVGVLARLQLWALQFCFGLLRAASGCFGLVQQNMSRILCTCFLISKQLWSCTCFYASSHSGCRVLVWQLFFFFFCSRREDPETDSLEKRSERPWPLKAEANYALTGFAATSHLFIPALPSAP